MMAVQGLTEIVVMAVTVVVVVEVAPRVADEDHPREAGCLREFDVERQRHSATRSDLASRSTAMGGVGWVLPYSWRAQRRLPSPRPY